MNVAGTNCRFSAEEMPPEEFEKVIKFEYSRDLPGQPSCWRGHDRAETRQDRQHVVGEGARWPRRWAGQHMPREGRGALHQDLGGGMGQVQHQRQRPGPGAGDDRHDREFLSKPEIYSKMTAEIPLHRLGVPDGHHRSRYSLGLRCIRLHDGTDPLHRRRSVSRVIEAER